MTTVSAGRSPPASASRPCGSGPSSWAARSSSEPRERSWDAAPRRAPDGGERMTRVMLVDDHPIVLSGLSALVESDDGLDLVAVARTAAEARDVTTQPDVAVVDLGLPDGDGIELGAALKRTWPALRVIVLTMTADDQAVLRSLGAGLDGYLLKDCDPEDVLAAIHTARAVPSCSAVVRRTRWWPPRHPHPGPTRWGRSTRGTSRSSTCSSGACRRRRWPRDSSWRRRPFGTGSRTCSPSSHRVPRGGDRAGSGGRARAGLRQRHLPCAASSRRGDRR